MVGRYGVDTCRGHSIYNVRMLLEHNQMQRCVSGVRRNVGEVTALTHQQPDYVAATIVGGKVCGCLSSFDLFAQDLFVHFVVNLPKWIHFGIT